jgi:hypothetical protein
MVGIIALIWNRVKVAARGGYDYFLLLLGKSSIWFPKKHFFKINIYFFNTLKCAANYAI